jgi:tryptophan halogenase
MSKQIKKIVIVGGGSAGWMTAATLSERLVNRDITVIESPNIPTVGVGESTLGFINSWMSMLNLKDNDWMKYCDATYKLSIRFGDFYKKGAGKFHYPFGKIDIEGNQAGKNDWYFKKILHPETPVSDYADCIYPQMALVNENKVSEKKDIIPKYNFQSDVAYHMDAAKFGVWLRDNYSKPRGVKHLLAEVKHIETNEEGVEYLLLDNGDKITADLFIDCTGFRSLILGGALKEPFTSYSGVLPNNKAWATQIPYNDRRREMECWTDCTAIDNGWVWNIPLWSRIGTGYVYSDKYVSDEQALEEFKEHLRSKGHKLEGDVKFRNINMRVGIHERLWVKNVCAIGLSAGFIEPLESNGLFSVHEFLYKLVRALDRFEDGSVSRLDIDGFNLACKNQFKGFAEFVVLHYALSHRDDTEYWRDVGRRDYYNEIFKLDFQGSYPENNLKLPISSKYNNYYLPDCGSGCIYTGLNYFPTDIHSLMYHNSEERDWVQYFNVSTKHLEDKKNNWKEAVKDEPYMYDYLKEKIYDGKEG